MRILKTLVIPILLSNLVGKADSAMHCKLAIKYGKQYGIRCTNTDR